ncbi:MAG: glucose-6-phosphate dehydrogenase [candidate division KSB1 bacterium]|nr:glucose-6-phosphate dehydrogenase [candidate division KSB1 bacterium]MDZ7273352.1 glucose-6-phosphate dehydrogenase [candidate division KSB1 bacterium]MDZ7288014.1 glucose-6-phosphate dehydrogenase [candidate division KSB1 bacterium]MDZ7300134.1 glucose-6-phosphate dehydrogenase [candidate division KSB1 bacterium]MDZ7351136.1 glucose-6-phosphate dehydrogenase [candidate division KSB1 bacterium]
MPHTTASENPLREGLRLERMPEPNVLVIFGASGDLTKRKLLPALFNLACDNLLPQDFAVVGFARREKTHAAFREEMVQAITQFSRNREFDGNMLQHFSERIFYHAATFEDEAGYAGLQRLLTELDTSHQTAGNRLFYLATPPEHYPVIVQRLGRTGMARNERGWTRVIIEKPFGRDLETARELNRQVLQVFDESQVFRIDHYLGKETVQNILVFRLANGIFEPIWNRHYIDHVQITVAEDLGVEGRGSYYETAGVMRDMIQNHMLQLLALVAMEPPIAFAAQEVRNEKVKVLQAIRPILPGDIATHTVRAQYGPGLVGGRLVPGYLQEPGVAPTSRTETFVALKLFVDNWRWAGVPFFLRSGKRLPKRATEIAIHFKSAPHLLFGAHTAGLEANVLALRIQPEEGITLRFAAKLPGAAIQVRTVNMDFRYGTSFGKPSPEAYERLLWDCMLGDSTLFTRRDEVEASWQFVTPILEAWQERNDQPLPQYQAGTWGPPQAETFIESEGRRWRRL